MINYEYIFKSKEKFRVIDNYVDELYQFQSNDDKGEFINEQGQVIAQLIEADPDKEWFTIAGILMGQIATRSILYRNIMSENQLPITFKYEV